MFTVKFNGNIIDGILALEDYDNIRGLIGSSMRFEAEEKTEPVVSYAYRFVLWEIIKYVKEKRIKKFDFG